MRGYELIIAVIVAVLVTFAAGIPVIPYLKKLKFGQEIREEGPKWHKSKQGTPTMGGIMIILGYFLAVGISMLVSIAFGDYINGELKTR